MKKYRAYNIEWDFDGEEAHPEMPNEMIVELEDDVDPESSIADALTTKTGWCVYGCSYEEIYGDEVNPIFVKLLHHIGHAVEVVGYGEKGKGFENVSIECVDCNEVLYDVDKYEETDTGRGDIQ